MIQEELDELEKLVLTDIFGGYAPENLVFRKGIIRYDLSPKVQEVINKMENLVKPLMDDRGYIDGTELKKYIQIPYVDIPDIKFRPIELYRNLQPLIKNLKGILQ